MTPRHARSGFTLVELLVATGILLILAGLSVGVISVALEGDRVPSSARQVQSYLEGARDRAIFAQENRGVRFLRSETRPNEVVSMIYIGSAGEFTGTAQYDDLMGAEDVLTQEDTGQTWTDLWNRGLLVNGSSVKVASGIRYQIHDDTFDTMTYPGQYIDRSPPRIKLARDWIGAVDPDPSMDAIGNGLANQGYTLELAPVPLADEEVVSLPQGTVIDVQQSQLPLFWQTFPGARMEVLFSPHGTVTGSTTASGLLHFVIADTRDTELGRAVGDPTKQGEELIVTLFTRTGLIETSPVDTTDVSAPPGADDPFNFAETGASE